MYPLLLVSRIPRVFREEEGCLRCPVMLNHSPIQDRAALSLSLPSSSFPYLAAAGKVEEEAIVAEEEKAAVKRKKDGVKVC